MIVPFTRGAQAQDVSPPNETSALLALAEMEKQGRFKTADLSTIRRHLDKGSVQPLIDKAESDKDIIRIKREMEKRGLDTTNPQLDIPGE